MIAFSMPGFTPQLPLTWRAPSDARLETFVQAPAGALELVRAIAMGTTNDWAYIAGPAGTGKSHLLLGACAQSSAAGMRTSYLSLAHARGRVRDALDAIDGAGLLALDDVDAIAGTHEDEVALFEAHNRLRLSGARVLYAAAVAPDGLALALPDLRSRFSQCTRIALDLLDDAGRRGVLLGRAERRGLVLEPAALDWLLRRVGRDLGGLTTLLDQLDRASLAAQRRVTVPFLRQVLGDVGR